MVPAPIQHSDVSIRMWCQHGLLIQHKQVCCKTRSIRNFQTDQVACWSPSDPRHNGFDCCAGLVCSNKLTSFLAEIGTIGYVSSLVLLLNETVWKPAPLLLIIKQRTILKRGFDCPLFAAVEDALLRLGFTDCLPTVSVRAREKS